MHYSRRRFLTLTSAAALALPGICNAHRWQGVALGAKAQIILDHPDAERLTGQALSEIQRLEGVFSLYRADSSLRRLNADGVLRAPSFELLECLAIAGRAHSATEGHFDPTVQPLWQVMAEAWVKGHAPSEVDIAQARSLIGFERVRFDSEIIELEPGQALTLNGIAQGYIADRVADLMRRQGVTDMLIDTGEISALGAWPIAVAGNKDRLSLTDRALATSAHGGTTFDPAGNVGHILDPKDGALRRPTIISISISAGNAAFADALSTGLSLSRSREDVASMLRNLKDARLESITIRSDS